MRASWSTRNRLFVHYNNDWDTVPNQISLVELDPDTLQARSAARRLELDGPRQPCEKNWLLFEHDEALFAIYQVDPHIVLRVDLTGAGPVRCWPVYRTEWDTTGLYPALRGAAGGDTAGAGRGELRFALSFAYAFAGTGGGKDCSGYGDAQAHRLVAPDQALAA